MERISCNVNCEPFRYKEYCHSHFNGFKNEYPTYLNGIIDQREYNEIIKNINNNSIRKLETPVLKTLLVTGGVLSYLFIGLPVFVGALIGNKVIYNKHNKKVKKDIINSLNQINSNPIVLEKNIEFCLVENRITKREVEYKIEVKCWVNENQSKQIQQQKNLLAQQQRERQIQEQREANTRNNIRNQVLNIGGAGNIMNIATSSIGPSTPKPLVDIPIDDTTPKTKR